MRTVPTLKPKHFDEDGLTTMVNGGLHFEVSLTVEDWIAVSPFRCGSFEDEELKLRKLAAKRRPSRIKLNPSTISSAEIVELCRASQRKLRKREYINVAYGLSIPFDRKWKVHTEIRKWDIWRKGEGQSLVIVAFDEDEKFVGYSSFGANCYAWIDPSDKYDVRFGMEMVYVLPERRGVGFGLDLSVATGMVCRDIFRAYYRAIPAGAHLAPHVSADYESEGGEAFTLQVKNELDIAVDMLREGRWRPSIGLSYTELEAGY